MNNMNTIPLPEDIWNIISYDLHVSKLQILAVCSKELNCFMSRNQGLQLYKSIYPCRDKLIKWNWRTSRRAQIEIKEPIETAIKIYEYHYLHPKTITFWDFVSLNEWIQNVLKYETLQVIHYKSHIKLYNLDKLISIRNLQKTQFLT